MSFEWVTLDFFFPTKVINIFQEKKNPSSYKGNNLHDNNIFVPKLPPTIALNNNISQVAACFENFFDEGSPPWAVILLNEPKFYSPQEDPNNRSQVQ